MGLFTAFGKNPSGERLERIKKSPNFSNGVFRNQSPTPMMLSRITMLGLMWKYFNRPKSTSPPGPLPSVQTDLSAIENEHPVIVWFGHSSYFIRVNRKNILVDPVLSGHASPFSFVARSFAGSNVYGAEEIPAIDVLLITHDHYDHLDHRTIRKIMPKVKRVCTSLGVGSHLEYWGMDKEIIEEFDWHDSRMVADDIEFVAAPARHFSGRTTKRNTTLWSSYILKSGSYKIYVGADSGFDAHFKMIGTRYGPFDLAILETGQYNTNWPFIHMMPEEAVQASVDLGAKVMMPVHWGKFVLSFHDWDEPVKRVKAKANELNVEVTTPMIGEPVILKESYPKTEWWTLV